MSTVVEIKDVRDLRKNVNNNKMSFKNALFSGYNKKEIDDYIKELNSDRLLENNAFTDRIAELEALIKKVKGEKEETEAKLESINGLIDDYKQKFRVNLLQLEEKENKIIKLQSQNEEYEVKLQEKEDAVVFLENENLKKQLASVTKERDEYSAENMNLKNDNDFISRKFMEIEKDYGALAQRLSCEMENNRELLSDISMLSIKIIEGNSHYSERTVKILAELLEYNKKHIEESVLLCSDLRKKLPFNE